MPDCKYEACGNPQPIDDEGACLARCAGVRDKIRARLGAVLTRYALREVENRKVQLTAVALKGVNTVCAGCDLQIVGDATAIPGSLFRPLRKGDVPLHDLCHEIWEEEAAVE